MMTINVRLFAFLLIILTSLAWSRPVPARIILPEGEEVSATFVRLQNDTVFYEVATPDSVQHFAVFKLDLKKVQLLEDNSLVDLNLSSFQVKSEAPKDTTKVEGPTLKIGKAVLIVNSYPADARVYIDNILLEGLTPLVIPNLENKKFHIMARKYLKGVDWWGTARVQVKEGDTIRININLLKPHTQLTIQSIPTEAEVYIDGEPSLSKLPTILTDTTLTDIQPAPERTVTLFKVGYYDTTVTVPVEAYMPNLVGIELHAILDDLPKLQAQIEFANHRKNKWWGRGFLWSSIAPFLAAGTVWILAERDWAKAADYKSYYEDAAFNSSETARFIKENKSYNESGDRKAQIAGGLGGLAILLGGIGIVLQF